MGAGEAVSCAMGAGAADLQGNYGSCLGGDEPGKAQRRQRERWWAALRNHRRCKQRRGAVYERPSCRESVFGKMLAIETMSLCAPYLQYNTLLITDVISCTWYEPVSPDQILSRRKQGEGNIHFPCSVDHEQDWQPYPVDPYSCYM